MFRATTLCALAVVLGLAGPLDAQMLGTYNSMPDVYQDRCTVDAGVALTASGACPDFLFGMPARPATPWPAGAVTTNHPNRLILATNGANNITRVHHPRTGFPGGGGVLTPLPLPATYGPANPVTGMTMDPATRFIFLADHFPNVSAHDPAIGMATVGGPWTITGINSVVGLDLDLCTGHLMAVDDFGGVVVWSIGAAGLITIDYRPWAFPAMIPPGVLATGVAIDRSSAAPCGPGLCPPYYVSWTDGQVIHGYLGVGALGALSSQGLSYSALPIRLPSPGSCTGTNLIANTSAFVHQGIPVDLLLSGVPAGIPSAIFGASLGYIPGGLVGPCGEVLWLLPPLLLTPPPVLPVAPGGDVVLPLGPLPYPLVACVQWAVIMPGGGIELSNGLNFEVSHL